MNPIRSTSTLLRFFLLALLGAALSSSSWGDETVHLVSDIDTTGEPYTLPCILSICPPPPLYFGARLDQLTALGDRLFFLADDRTSGHELWTTEGSDESTRLVADAVPGPDGSGSTILGATRDRIVVWSRVDGGTLWSTTGSGFQPIDFDCAGCESVDAVRREPFGDWLYFQLYKPALERYILVRTDGFSAHQVDILCDLPHFCLERVRQNLVWADALYYDHYFPGHLRRVFRLDHPTAEPVEIDAQCSWGQDLQPVGGQLLFVGTCYDPPADLHRNGLYATSDLEEAPELLVPFVTFPPGGGAGTLPLQPKELTAFGSTHAAFLVDTTLWLTDGTAPGTVEVGPFGSVTAMVELEDRLLLSGQRNSQDGLWSVTTGGVVQPLAAVAVTSTPATSHRRDGTAFALFAADEVGFGSEPWITDGTPGGTHRLGDLRAGAEGSAPGRSGHLSTGFVTAGDRTYFGADDGIHDAELWAFDHSISAPPSGCTATSTTLCLAEGRFAVSVDWRDFANREGVGTAVPFTVESGVFWFFEDVRYELVVKIIDGRSNNGHFWVFHGSLTNVEYTLTVTDTETGRVWSRTNPLGSFGSDGDIEAFPGT